MRQPLVALPLSIVLLFNLNIYCIMKKICVVPSISLVSVIICRYYSLSSSSLLMYKFKKFLLLLLHHMYISRVYSMKFRFYCFVFKIKIIDGLYYVYQLKSRSCKDLLVFDESLF